MFGMLGLAPFGLRQIELVANKINNRLTDGEFGSSWTKLSASTTPAYMDVSILRSISLVPEWRTQVIVPNTADAQVIEVKIMYDHGVTR